MRECYSYLCENCKYTNIYQRRIQRGRGGGVDISLKKVPLIRIYSLKKYNRIMGKKRKREGGLGKNIESNIRHFFNMGGMGQNHLFRGVWKDIPSRFASNIHILFSP